MIISYYKKFVYLRTIKVASSSLEFYLSEFCENEDIITPLDYEEEKLKKKYNFPLTQNNKLKKFSLSIKNILRFKIYSNKRIHEHSSIDQISSKKIKQKISNFFFFTFVRNPFDWIVSYFWWYLYHNDKKSVSYLNSLNSKKINFLFKKFMKNESKFFFNSNKNIVTSRNFKIKVFKLENFQKSIKFIKKKLNLKNEKKKIDDLKLKSLKIKKKIKLDVEDVDMILRNGSFFFETFKYSRKIPTKYR